MLLTKRDGTLAENIRREILKGLASGKKENGYGQGIYRAKFKIPWAPQAFLKQQYPDEHNLQLGYIITIVGSGVDAQALTCAGYLSQVWPATSLDTLRALQEAVTNGRESLTNVTYLVNHSPQLDTDRLQASRQTELGSPWSSQIRKPLQLSRGPSRP